MPKAKNSKKKRESVEIRGKSKAEHFDVSEYGTIAEFQDEQQSMALEMYSKSNESAAEGWCHSEEDAPQNNITAKNRKSRTPVCHCRNYNCTCISLTHGIFSGIDDGKTKSKPLKSKSTNASVLRDAAILLKEDQQRQQKILNLLSAPKTCFDYETYLEDLREIREREAIIELEKKHLSGQISYEEAILAKQRVIDENVKKREEYLEEKAAFEAELNIFKEQELSKVRDLVKYVHTQHEKTKIKQQAVVKTKQKAAREVTIDIKKKLEKTFRERELEIEKKITAIREFKILQQIKKEELNSREEKMTKLIGVSFEELKARLALYKRHLKEELIKKKSSILKQNCRREMLKTAASNFIRAIKNECKSVDLGSLKGQNKLKSGCTSRPLTLEKHRLAVEVEQINVMRAKLEQARMARQASHK